MKPSKDLYLQNRKLLKELTYDKKHFRPTVGDCEKWFVILNTQIFGNKLSPVTKISFAKSWDFHAVYTYYSKKDPKYPETEIVLEDEFSCMKIFVEVLAHELIHHFQFLHGEPLGHGPSFQAWRDNFKLKGLSLSRIYEK